ncbi:Uncharacterized protein PBTT_00405 [Plasmodiophora brassicae]
MPSFPVAFIALLFVSAPVAFSDAVVDDELESGKPFFTGKVAEVVQMFRDQRSPADIKKGILHMLGGAQADDDLNSKIDALTADDVMKHVSGIAGMALDPSPDAQKQFLDTLLSDKMPPAVMTALTDFLQHKAVASLLGVDPGAADDMHGEQDEFATDDEADDEDDDVDDSSEL